MEGEQSGQEIAQRLRMKITSFNELDLQTNSAAVQPFAATTSTGTTGWWHRLFETVAPLGYEDQGGFHFGPEPTLTGTENSDS